jgi:hypothetical protein
VHLTMHTTPVEGLYQRKRSSTSPYKPASSYIAKVQVPS